MVVTDTDGLGSGLLAAGHPGSCDPHRAAESADRHGGSELWGAEQRPWGSRLGFSSVPLPGPQHRHGGDCETQRNLARAGMGWQLLNFIAGNQACRDHREGSSLAPGCGQKPRRSQRQESPALARGLEAEPGSQGSAAPHVPTQAPAEKQLGDVQSTPRTAACSRRLFSELNTVSFGLSCMLAAGSCLD